MSNSTLVQYTKLSPHYRKRTEKISKITIHHAAVVNASLEGLGNGFSGSRVASANYGIDVNGKVGMYVEESNRAITSSNTSNDDVAVTIEVVNDGGAPDWHISDKALNALVDLCVDICKRNGIKKLNYDGTKNGNLTRHNMFAATACPGPYLQSKFPWIAEQVNKRLGVVEQKPVATTSNFKIGDEVKLVSGAKYTNGKSIPSFVFNSKLYVREIQSGNIVISTLKTGAVTGVVDEKYLTKYNNSNSITAPTTTIKPTTQTVTPKFKIGEEVKLVSGAKYTNGKSVPSWVIKSKLYVREIQGENVVISTQKSGAITGIVNQKYLGVTTTTVATTTTALKVGDRVKVVTGAKYTTGQKVPLWVRACTLYVREIQGNNVVISTVKTGAITGIVSKNDLKKV